MMDEMGSLTKRLSAGMVRGRTGRQLGSTEMKLLESKMPRRGQSMTSTTGKQLGPEEMRKMKRLGSRMSDRLIGRFK